MTEEQTNAENQVAAQSNSTKEDNLVKMRKKLEQTERESQRKEAEMQNRLDSLQQQIERMSGGSSQQGGNDPYSQYGIERDGLVEGEKLVRVLEKERDKLKKEFQKEARATFEEIERGRYQERLRNKHRDYDDVMSEENIALLTTTDPKYARALSNIQDDYARRELAYEKIKEIKESEQRRSAQELVDKNKSSAYHYAPGGSQGSSNQADLRGFVNDPEAKAKAYAKLKAAQRKGF